MKLSLFVEKMANLKAENKLLKFTIVLVALGCLSSSYFAYKATINQKVVILPPVVDDRVVITGTDVNDAYLKMFSKYSLNLLFNYTPQTFKDQASDLLTMSTPNFYDSLENKITDMADGIDSLQITSMFFPRKLTVDKGKQQITVTGLRISTAQGQEIENKMKTMMIEYKIDNGRFYINGINELSS